MEWSIGKIHRRRSGGAHLAAIVAALVVTGCAGRVMPEPHVPPRTLQQAMTDSVRTVLEGALGSGAFPGAVAVIGRRDGVIAHVAVGVLDSADPSAPTERTLWDVASLTKVVGTTSAVMLLSERGLLRLDAVVSSYLPAWRIPGHERVTVRHLLSHNSGLPAFRRLWLEAENTDEARQLLYHTRLVDAPGTRTTYSDIGAFLLGEVVEALADEPLDRFLDRELFLPLGMHDTMFRPDSVHAARAAPTERDGWRGRHLRGEVHDENASLLGGVAGHAGLFSTAHDLTRFARLMLGDGAIDGVRLFSARTLAAFTTVQDPSSSSRALGWDTADGRNSGGRCLSHRAFGHTGFTGTSMWLDPGRDLFVILLSNRVNPTRENPRIGQVRLDVIHAICAVLDQHPGASPFPMSSLTRPTPP